jgi:hypothetical protein
MFALGSGCLLGQSSYRGQEVWVARVAGAGSVKAITNGVAWLFLRVLAETRRGVLVKCSKFRQPNLQKWISVATNLFSSIDFLHHIFMLFIISTDNQNYLKSLKYY